MSRPEMDELRQYADRVLSDGLLLMRPPMHGLSFGDGIARVVLDRNGSFQAELIVFGPGVCVAPHTHPDCDSIDVLIAGDATIVRDGVTVVHPRPARRSGVSRWFGRRLEIPAACVHGGTAGASGACILSLQRWRNGAAPSHIVETWADAS